MTSEAWLLTRSCTTGWTDWIHGDLWLTSDALVRVSLGLRRTVANGTFRTLVRPVQADAGDPGLERSRVLAGRRTNKYLAFDDIASASLHRGFSSARLSIATYTGQRHKLLWLVSDPAYLALWEVLPERLGERFTLD